MLMLEEGAYSAKLCCFPHSTIVLFTGEAAAKCSGHYMECALLASLS